MSLLHEHAEVCARPCRVRGKRCTIGDILSKYMEPAKFLFYWNLALYKVKSGKPCQFGTTPTEVAMSQLKAYNSNVFTSTHERCEVTLDLFSFGKIISTHMKRRAPPGMQDVSPASCHAHAMSILRCHLCDGKIAAPTPTSGKDSSSTTVQAREK